MLRFRTTVCVLANVLDAFPGYTPAGTVIDKGQGWYKVQISGVEGVANFRAADLCASDGSMPPSGKPASLESPLKNYAHSSPAAVAAAAVTNTPGRSVFARRESGLPPRHPPSDEPVRNIKHSRVCTAIPVPLFNSCQSSAALRNCSCSADVARPFTDMLRGECAPSDCGLRQTGVDGKRAAVNWPRTLRALTST